MPERSEKFDADSVRKEWDAAADAYAEEQATGRDHYRLQFFGPAQVALCGEVRGLRLLDVGCGSGYFAREMACRGAVVTAVDLSPPILP
jgi:2-polyprenyl-3-methyl-5-hydroxy-6-metoxy-1,4-benzoquinol methylase